MTHKTNDNQKGKQTTTNEKWIWKQHKKVKTEANRYTHMQSVSLKSVSRLNLFEFLVLILNNVFYSTFY